ncbi:dolichyl-phosphate-mannose--protein mannosyltransferase [Microlunatus sp. Gsoil 973]|uniref:dolichyl-phosphate-mannose--protein mannosyltransferase n=1 Tax=Microlunatus sp. Gsoil 973 TaxID=2672569 RepID=UPI0012B456B0|nr:phospholipid carrier-dependent glycosyltransferase [Microlunatus sp. Gsoil 973]QGN35570.1 phospholipid carrier-dependent glycosyltransferase [Microlunatus sp. Gsoil 973]
MPDPQPTTVQRLRSALPADRLTGWVTTLVITVIAFVIRLINIGRPRYIVFDETYYAKDAWSLVHFGFERNWADNANAVLRAGGLPSPEHGAEFVVHPPIGKLLIGIGELIFGMNSFGWRVASLVFGSLLVLITIRLVRRVSRSTLIGAVAGVLLTVDGLAFVMSRIALLDIFLAFFIVAGVACLAADRDWFRNRLADHIHRSGKPDLDGGYGPLLLVRPWQLLAGLMFGLGLGTKWNAVYVLAAFCVLSLAWDVGARRLAGAERTAGLALIRDGLGKFASVVVLGGIVYVGSWVSWFATSGGYDREWGRDNPTAWTTRILGSAFASWLHDQRDIYDFHTGSYINHQTHTYNADPGGWLVIARTIGIDAVNDIKPGTHGCPPGGEKCLSVISGIGTPLLWWGAVIALVVALLLWVGGRDWRFGIPIVGVLSSWLPWFGYTSRPQFFFYAITIIPFSVMAVALCLGLLIGKIPRDPVSRRARMAGGIVAGAFVALVAVNFGYIYPILTDQVLPYSKWLARMWFRGWI